MSGILQLVTRGKSHVVSFVLRTRNSNNMTRWSDPAATESSLLWWAGGGELGDLELTVQWISSILCVSAASRSDLCHAGSCSDGLANISCSRLVLRRWLRQVLWCRETSLVAHLVDEML